MFKLVPKTVTLVFAILLFAMNIATLKADVLSENNDQKTAVSIGLTGNAELLSQESSIGTRIEGTFYNPDLKLESRSTTLTIKGSIAKTSEQYLGAFLMDIGKAMPNERKSGLSLHLGVDANPQVIKLDLLPGIGSNTGQSAHTIHARLPILGGSIFDRQSKTSFYATGLKIENLFLVSEKVSLMADLEYDYLFAGRDNSNLLAISSGYYLSQNYGLNYQVDESIFLKAESSFDTLNYRTRDKNEPALSRGSAMEDPQSSFVLTGTASIGAQF